MKEENDEWKLKFMNLPSNEQIYFVQKVTLDEKLQKEFLLRLKDQDES